MVMVMMAVVMVVAVVMADDDKVLAVPADIVDAGHGERDVASVREPRVRLQLQLFSVHAGRLRMPYGRAVQMKHIERLETCKFASIFVLFPQPASTTMITGGKKGKGWGVWKEENAP